MMSGHVETHQGDVVRQQPGTALSIQDGQGEFNGAQVATLQQLGVEGATREDMAVFFHQCVRTGLDPFARQIYMIERQGKQTIQTGIDGLRLVARRAVDRSGERLGYTDTLWCGPDGQWTDVWLKSEPPAAAKVTVLRGGEAYSAVALFNEYAGRKRNGDLNSMWTQKGTLMIAKCAEALALRKAFPQDLSGLYTADEMEQVGEPTQQPAPAKYQPEPQQQPAASAAPAADTVTGEVIDEAPAQEQPAPAADTTTDTPEQIKADVEAAVAAGSVQDLQRIWRRAKAAGAPEHVLTYITDTAKSIQEA